MSCGNIWGDGNVEKIFLKEMTCCVFDSICKEYLYV
jgi:hypothetical protein